MKTALKISFLFWCILFFVTNKTNAQFKVSGTVYDSSGIYFLEAVSVLSVSGKGTATDINGHYEISVSEKDSIWFSYLGKPTLKFPVAEIMDITRFDISLQVSITVLKEVKIRPPNYRLDSIRNRIDYAKVFNYQKPSLRTIVKAFYIIYVAIDINELIRAFQKRKIRSTMSFKQRLLEEEKNKFIDRRFNRVLVHKLTGQDANELDRFMIICRPQYEFTLNASDYDLQEYIYQEYKKWKMLKGELYLFQ